VDPTTDIDKFAGVTTSGEATPNAAEAANASSEVVKQLFEDAFEVGVDFLKESKNPIVAALGSQLEDASSVYNLIYNNINPFSDAEAIGKLSGTLLSEYVNGQDITDTATELATTVATTAAGATGIPFAKTAALGFIAFGNKVVSTAIDLYFEMETQEGLALLPNPVVLPGQVPGTPIQLGSGPDVAPQPVTGTPDNAGNMSYSVPAANPGETYNLDPSGSSAYTLVENAGSPKIDTVTLPASDGVSYYRVSAQTASGWSPPQLTAPNVPLILPHGTAGITIETLGSTHQAVVSNSPISIGLTFTDNGTFSGTLTSGSPPGSLSAIPSDFNGDGTSDILWQNTNGQPAVWLLNNTAPFNEPAVGGNPGPSWQVIGAGDFNGDGDADILWQNSNGQPAIWLMNGTTPFNESVVGGNPGPSWQVIGAGDFNGDGDADILWQNTNGQAAIWLMNGTTPFNESVVGANPGPSWHVVGTGDFNGDGDADILWQNDNGQAAIWLMNGTTPLSEPVIGNPGPSWHIVGTGDFNGDGAADILWQYNNTANPSDPLNGQAAIWLMNGTTPFSEVLVGSNPGPSWHIIGTGDYNGDGKSDILWQNTNGQASIWLMNGTTPTAEVLVGSNPGPTWHIHAAS
jgi:hypothetical protein